MNRYLRFPWQNFLTLQHFLLMYGVGPNHYAPEVGQYLPASPGIKISNPWSCSKTEVEVYVVVNCQGWTLTGQTPHSKIYPCTLTVAISVLQVIPGDLFLCHLGWIHQAVTVRGVLECDLRNKSSNWATSSDRLKNPCLHRESYDREGETNKTREY